MKLSEIRIAMSKKLNVSDKICTSPNLILNFFFKQIAPFFAIFHLYIKLGMVVVKKDRVMQFGQESFIALYVHMNNEVSQIGTSKIAQGFF